MMYIKRTHLLLLFFFILSSAVNAAIYKWVDEDGQVHFGNQPPAQSDNKKVKEHTGNSIKAHKDESSPQGERTSSSYRNTQSDKETEVLDCYAAVDNAKSSIKAVLQDGNERYRSGKMSREKYREGAEKIKNGAKSFTLSDCEHSKGKKRKFYSCMTRSQGEVEQALLCVMANPF